MDIWNLGNGLGLPDTFANHLEGLLFKRQHGVRRERAPRMLPISRAGRNKAMVSLFARHLCAYAVEVCAPHAVLKSGHLQLTAVDNCLAFRVVCPAKIERLFG